MGLSCKVMLGLFSIFSWEHNVYGKLGYHTCIWEMRSEEKNYLALQNLWRSYSSGVATRLGQLLSWHGCWGRACHLTAVASTLPSAWPVLVLGECFPTRFIPKGRRVMFSLCLPGSLTPLLQTASLWAKPDGGGSNPFLRSGSENQWP